MQHSVPRLPLALFWGHSLENGGLVMLAPGAPKSGAHGKWGALLPSLR